MTESYPHPSHRRKTPSFSSSLLDSILRSIDESNDGASHDNNGNNNHNHDHDHENSFCVSEPKRSNKNQQRIDHWMETHNRNGYVSSKNYNKFSSDSSSSGTETPSTYRSLPNSFTISRKAVFLDDTQKESSSFMRSTKLKAMKIDDEQKKPKQKQKQPVSPGRRISAFICSLFASKKAKQDKVMTCTLSSSKKQASSSVKRSVRFYPVKDTVIKSIGERDSNSMTSPNYMKNYKNFVVSTEDDEDEEDDLFELEIAGGYGRELPVFETTDLRKIRI
ncbi:putative protein BIG GRAIN 1 [Helianthus annuus]|nr:putative protein BIG GRAIN 1 [Helianthus annuus]